MNLSKNIKLTSKKHETFDPRFAQLIRIVKWQGRGLILLLILMIGLYFYTKIQAPTIPPLTQKQVLCKEEVPLKSPEYSNFIYQGSKSLHYGDRVENPTVVLMGQIHDYAKALKQWSEIRLIVNGAAVPLSSYGNYLVELNLKPGNNVIETALHTGTEIINRTQVNLEYIEAPIIKTGPVQGPSIQPNPLPVSNQP